MIDLPDIRRRELVIGMGLSAMLPWRMALAGSDSESAVSAQFSSERWVNHWFFKSRIQTHTRLPYAQRDTVAFKKWSQYMDELGVSVYTRHIKTEGENAWWKSSVGASVGTDVVQRLVKEASARGQHLIGYYRHIEDSWVESNKPDWLCRDANGKPVKSTRGLYTCLNSPYRDFLFQRFSEAIDIGVSGLYLDKDHMPPEGCWCKFCQDKFKSLGVGLFPRSADPRDQAWLLMNEMINESVGSFMSEARQRVHGIRADAVLIVSAGPVPMMVSRHLDFRTVAAADSSKTEFAAAGREPKVACSIRSGPIDGLSADIQQSFGFAAVRDGAGGRPAHVWIPKLRRRQDIQMAISGVVGSGCIANLDIEPATWDADRVDIAAAIADVRSLGNLMAQAQPAGDVAMVIPSGRPLDSRQDTERWLRRAYETYAQASLLRRPLRLLPEIELQSALAGSMSAFIVPDMGILSAPAKKTLSAVSQPRKVFVLDSTDTGVYVISGGTTRKTLAEVLPACQGLEVTGGAPELQVNFFNDMQGRPIVCISQPVAELGRLMKGRNPERRVKQAAPKSDVDQVRIGWLTNSFREGWFLLADGRKVSSSKSNGKSSAALALDKTVTAFSLK